MLFYEENSTKGKIRYTLLQFIVIIYFFTLGIDSIQASWRGSEENQFIFKKYQISDDITSPFKISEVFGIDTLYYFESNISGFFITTIDGKTFSEITGIRAQYQDKKGNQWLLTLDTQSSISLVRLSDKKEIKFKNSDFVGLFFKTDEKNNVKLNPDFEKVYNQHQDETAQRNSAHMTMEQQRMREQMFRDQKMIMKQITREAMDREQKIIERVRKN